jgi:HAD superfamily hydrolase (TIGR01484 family)
MTVTRLAPQAFSEVSDAKLATCFGLLTDIDDTLTRNGDIEPVALQALQQLQTEGVPVLAITGRAAEWCALKVLVWPLAGIVAENGAVLVRRMGDGTEMIFSQSGAERGAHRRRLEAFLRQLAVDIPEAKPAQDHIQRLTDVAVDHGEFAHLSADEVERVVALMRLHGLSVSVSSIHINAWLGDHDKATGAEWAVPLLFGRPFRSREWVFVGDSPNDQALFACVENSVGVANIRPFLDTMTHRPTAITALDRGAGFAEVAERILAALRARNRHPQR